MNSIPHLRLPLITSVICALLTSCPALRLGAAPSATGNKSAPSRAAAIRTTESVRTGTTISPDGQAAVTSIDRKWDARTGTGTLNEAAVTPDGRVSSREANITRQSDGTIVTKGTFTDFDGRPFNYTETTRRTPAGQQVEGNMVDVDGKVSTYVTTSARAENNQVKRTTLITRANGSTETRVELLTPPRDVTVAVR